MRELHPYDCPCLAGGSQLRDTRRLPSNMTGHGASHGDASQLNVLGYPIDDDETFPTSNERSRAGDVVRFILVYPCSGRAVRGDVTDDEWRKLLKPDQYAVLRQSATERPFSSPLLNEHRPGVFDCAGCDHGLFSSETKFDSGTGWPSFWATLGDGAIGTTRDASLGMIRSAVHCARCGGHLGHVFDDGPKVTGLRYCMNGAALTFKPAVA